MKPAWWIGLGIALAGGGFVGGMQFQQWRGGGEAPGARDAEASVPPSVEEPEPGPGAATLVVLTQPPSTLRVRVAGRIRSGRTPITLTGLRPGSHELVVERKGYRTYREKVELKPGERAERLVTMRDELGLDYLNQIAFPRIRVEVYEDALDGRIVGVFGRLENRGPRTLRKVQIRMRFVDEVGKIRSEVFVHPLLAGDTGPDRPLAPGAGHDFGVKAPGVPVEHCCDRADWQVTLIDAR